MLLAAESTIASAGQIRALAVLLLFMSFKILWFASFFSIVLPLSLPLSSCPFHKGHTFQFCLRRLVYPPPTTEVCIVLQGAAQVDILSHLHFSDFPLLHLNSPSI